MSKISDIEDIFDDLDSPELDPDSDFTWGNVEDEYEDDDHGVNDYE